MLYYIKRMAPVAFAAIFMVSCTDNATKKPSTEETEIVTMDSTTTKVEENTSALEAQTKKVENALESVDTEFDTKK